MNRKMIAYVLGMLLLLEGALMLLPSLVALLCGEEAIFGFLASIVVLGVTGLVLLRARPEDKTIYARDGFMIVSLGWILLSLFGALPFFFSGEIPNYLDAVFESVSGFTTTGASILSDVESVSKSVLFWRSFSHWIGGMGVLVFVMAVLPIAGGGGNLHLMRAESPGPDVGKLVPKSNRTARILYGIYLAMTAVEFLLLLCGDCDVFESLTLTFGTAGTGGFSVLNSGIASYSNYTKIVINVFMALFGVNFNLYFLLLCGKVRDVLKSEELRAYVLVMLATIVVVAVNIRDLFDTVPQAILASSFQVSSVMTTTGYVTCDFNLWPELSRVLLLLVMCVGTCAGSTGGGIKVSRILLLLKGAKREIKRLAHPRSVSVITFNKKRVGDEVIQGTSVFLAVYVMIFVVSVLLVSIDGFDTVSNVTGVIATMNNIGPGLGVVGAVGNYGGYGWLSKLVFIADMLLGRLEIFPLLLLFSPTLRKRNRAGRGVVSA